MNWKKNAFSYILWLAYTAMVGMGVLSISFAIGGLVNFKKEYCIAMAVGVLIISGLLVFGMRKLWLCCKLSSFVSDNLVTKIVEALLVVGAVAAGIYLRVDGLMSMDAFSEGIVYYETATVEAGKSIPQIVHGATYLYLSLLHGIFIFAGNKIFVAVIVQMILQLLAGIVVYFVVRRMGGAFAGILSSAFFMLSPYMVGEAFVLSPAYLFLLIYSLVLLIIVLILPKNSGSPVWYILTGVFIGLVVYLDIFGVTLLLFLAGVFCLERECHERFRNSRIAVFLFGILGAAVGFWGAIGIDAIVSKKDFFKVLAAWAEIYCPQEIILPVMPGNISTLIEYGILFVILSMGIFSFWCRRTFERQGIWTLALIVFIPLQAFQMMQQNAGNEVYVYIFLTILAGVAVESIFLNENAEEKAMDVFQVLEKEAMEAEEKEMAKDMEKEKTDNNVDNDNKNETSEPPKVQFLENPLPLPKKHEPKVMDYKLTEENKENDFDLDVSDDDDFDI